LEYYLKTDKKECSLASLEHHEKLDGTGYPVGTSNISKYTQLISPVDIMDALMTKRPYRKKQFTMRASLDFLLQEANEGRLNKEVVLTLISFARKSKPDLESLKISEKFRDELPEDLAHEKYL
jgi:HD-GYP domain-containing protein (c-di-GMP phosphodiesterase class II)